MSQCGIGMAMAAHSPMWSFGAPTEVHVSSVLSLSLSEALSEGLIN